MQNLLRLSKKIKNCQNQTQEKERNHGIKKTVKKHTQYWYKGKTQTYIAYSKIVVTRLKIKKKNYLKTTYLTQD